LESQSLPEISKLHARILLITCAAMYGSNFVGTKILQQTLAPSMITTLRFLIGSLFFVGHLYNFRGDLAIVKGGIELGVWTASGFLVQAITLQYTTANKNAFLCALSVVMIPILESMMCCFTSKYCRLCPTHLAHSSTKPNNLHGVIIPAAFSVSGILALEYGGLDPPSSIDAVVLLAPICFAMGLWRTEQIAAQFPNDTLVITGTLLFTTTSICLSYSILSGEFPMSLSDLSIAYSTIFLDWKVLCGLLYSGELRRGISFRYMTFVLRDLYDCLEFLRRTMLPEGPDCRRNDCHIFLGTSLCCGPFLNIFTRVFWLQLDGGSLLYHLSLLMELAHCPNTLPMSSFLSHF
jgi:hypothetical protein